MISTVLVGNRKIVSVLVAGFSAVLQVTNDVNNHDYQRRIARPLL